MNKTIIYYYSKTGNNKYLAEKTAQLGNFDIEEIEPKFSSYFMLLLSQVTTINFGIRPPSKKPSEYERIILCGPLWMGKIAAPITGFLKKHKSNITDVHLITCCGSSDEKKDDAFGYEMVFKKLKKKHKKLLKSIRAFPITLILTKDQLKDNDAMMNARLNDDTFKGEIKRRLNDFVKSLS